jgi:hypothetical protein
MTKPIRERERIFRRLIMFTKILGFLGLSGCVLPPVAGEREKLDAVAKKDRPSILFVGNSYSFGIPKKFGELSASRGKDVRIGHSTYSGWSLTKHSRNPGTLKKLQEGEWDVIVIQDYSTNPSHNERERRMKMDPGVQFFATEARALGAVPLLYQTWGRRDGNPDIAGDDFYKMNDRVRKGYLSASRNGGGIVTVKAGDAWEREFRAGRGADLFYEDGSHPSGYGNEVTAEEFYRTIFRE